MVGGQHFFNSGVEFLKKPLKLFFAEVVRLLLYAVAAGVAFDLRKIQLYSHTPQAINGFGARPVKTNGPGPLDGTQYKATRFDFGPLKLA